MPDAAPGAPRQRQPSDQSAEGSRANVLASRAGRLVQSPHTSAHDARRLRRHASAES